MTQTLITRAGLARLRDELEHLTTTRRQEIAERIRYAVSSERNIAENVDYHDARKEQALLERRIATLQERIADADVVDPDAENGVLDVGERVRLRDLENDEEIQYELVGRSKQTHSPDASRLRRRSDARCSVAGVARSLRSMHRRAGCGSRFWRSRSPPAASHAKAAAPPRGNEPPKRSSARDPVATVIASEHVATRNDAASMTSTEEQT